MLGSSTYMFLNDIVKSLYDLKSYTFKTDVKP